MNKKNHIKISKDLVESLAGKVLEKLLFESILLLKEKKNALWNFFPSQLLHYGL